MDYKIAICKPLTEEILIAGGNRDLMVVNVTAGAVFIFGLHIFWITPVFIIFHFLNIYATKKDKKFFEIFRCYINYKKYYRS